MGTARERIVQRRHRLVPLATLGMLPANAELKSGLAGVVQQVVERLHREAPAEKMARLLMASFVLTGLRIPRQIAAELFKGVRAMRDSDTYMAIVEEGIEKGTIQEARRIVDRLGREAFSAQAKGERRVWTQSAIGAGSNRWCCASVR